MNRKHYFVEIFDISFYDSSPFTTMPNTLLGPFKNKRNANIALDNFGFDPEITGLLGYSSRIIMSKEVYKQF
jgi:hypothetical protein